MTASAETLRLRALSDDELLRRLGELLGRARRDEAELVPHVGEVDGRRLYAREAAASMFAYCTEVLHLSEQEAYLRITVARAARTHPVLLEMLADGRLHLSGMVKLVPLLTQANCEALLQRAVHRSKREIEELVAELAPQPDVAPVVRRLPPPRLSRQPWPCAPAPDGGVQTGAAEAAASPAAAAQQAGAPLCAQLGPDRVPTALGSTPIRSPLRPPVVEPLAPARYKVEFTAGLALRDKLARLRALMRSSVPDGDLATIIELAVTEKLERLEARRLGTTSSPRTSLDQVDTTASSRHIPAAVRRAVYERDGGRCSFVSQEGRRCTAREGLEFHHHGQPYGRGGDHSPENVRLMCRTHNAYQAERDYGGRWGGRRRELQVTAGPHSLSRRGSSPSE